MYQSPTIRRTSAAMQNRIRLPCLTTKKLEQRLQLTRGNKAAKPAFLKIQSVRLWDVSTIPGQAFSTQSCISSTLIPISVNRLDTFCVNDTPAGIGLEQYSQSDSLLLLYVLYDCGHCI